MTVDEKYIYLINGADVNNFAMPYNKLSPCERVSLLNKTSQSIPDCIFLDS